jgi:hypothetical protein
MIGSVYTNDGRNFCFESGCTEKTKAATNNWKLHSFTSGLIFYQNLGPINSQTFVKRLLYYSLSGQGL